MGYMFIVMASYFIINSSIMYNYVKAIPYLADVK